jgi:DNA uptake protein ComE-like DNA-binding protein
MNLKSSGNKWFITRTEYAGAFFMLILAAGIALIPRIYLGSKTSDSLAFNYDSNTVAAVLQEHLRLTDSFYRAGRPAKIHIGKATIDDLLALGLTEEQAERIWQKYRFSKRKPDFRQLMRETGVDSHKLSAFIYDRKKESRYEGKNSISIIELNSADTNALKALPGIGPATARRIVNFRNALGGFLNKEQLLETRYVDTLVLRAMFDRFTVTEDLIRKIKVNTTNVEELAKHPYLSQFQAKIIIAYKTQHAPLTEEKFKKIKAIPLTVMNKILPYLNFDVH